MANQRDRIRVHIEGKEYNVVGGEFKEMLAAVKQIAGRRFVSELKVWQLPGSAEKIQNQLDISGYRLEGGNPVAQQPAPVIAARTGSDRIRILAGGQQLAVVGGNFQEMLAVVKGLPGRRFDGEAKIWEIPGDVGIIKGLVEAAGYQLEGAERISVKDLPEMEPPDFTGPGEPPPYEPPHFEEVVEPQPFEPPDWDLTPPPPPPDMPPDWFDQDQFPPEDYNYPDEPPFEAFQPPFEPPTPVTASGSSGGDRIRLRAGGQSLVVTGGSFQAMLTTIKNIPGRRFNGQDKIWEFPDDITIDSVAQAVEVAGFRLEAA